MADNTANNKRIAKNSLYMSIRMVFVLLISLYATRAVLKALGVEDYGVYNVVAGFVSMFAFLNTSMASATQRFFNFELGKNGEAGANVVYNTAFVIHLLLAIIVVIVTIPVGLWYLHHEMVLPEGRMFAAECIFYFSVAALFVTIITVPYTAAVMAHERMNFYAIVGIIDAILKLVVVLILPYLSGDHLIWYGTLYLATTILDLIFYLSYSKSHFPEIHFVQSSPRHLFGPMLSFSGWGLLGSFSFILRTQGTNLLLNAFFGPAVNAAKGVAEQINGALNTFIGNIITPARPQVIQSYSQNNFDRAWHLTYSVSKLVTIIFFMLALPISLEINFILHLWLGNNVPEHTNWFVILILLAGFFGSMTNPISIIIHATGKVRFYHLVSSISNLFSLPLAYVLLTFSPIPEYAFVAMALTMLSNYIAALVSAKRHGRLAFGEYSRKVLLPIGKVIALASPICLSIAFCMSEGWLRLLCVVPISFFTIILVAFFFALNKREKELVQSVFNKLLKRFCSLCHNSN